MCDVPTDGRPDGRTDGRTDGRMDTPSCRDATAHLKIDMNMKPKKFCPHPLQGKKKSSKIITLTRKMFKIHKYHAKPMFIYLT